VPDDTEPCGTECRDEPVGTWPAIEADAEAVIGEHAVHLGEGGFEPGVVVVIGDRAPVAAAVARDVGRVGEDKIDAAGAKSGKDVQAIAVDDGVGW